MMSPTTVTPQPAHDLLVEVQQHALLDSAGKGDK